MSRAETAGYRTERVTGTLFGPIPVSESGQRAPSANGSVQRLDGLTQERQNESPRIGCCLPESVSHGVEVSEELAVRRVTEIIAISLVSSLGSSEIPAPSRLRFAGRRPFPIAESGVRRIPPGP